jgi:hypothetical protein
VCEILHLENLETNVQLLLLLLLLQKGKKKLENLAEMLKQVSDSAKPT